MPCEWLKSPDGTVIHINRGRGGKVMTCQFCRRRYTEGKLCDFALGDGKTCDAAMCEQCATTVGGQHSDLGDGFTKLNDTVDYCPNHKGDPAMADNFPRTRQGLERALFKKLPGKANCRGCDAPIEWWETPKGRKIPMTVTIRGSFEELTMHLDACPNRGEFHGAPAGDARPPQKYTHLDAVHAMRDRTDARVVVLVTDTGAVAAWRKDIPAEELRQDLISAANFVRAEIHKQEAKR